MIVGHGDITNIKCDEARNKSSLTISLIANEPDDPTSLISSHCTGVVVEVEKMMSHISELLL